MAIPEWLPAKGDKEIKYTLSLVNGVCQMHKQEVGGGWLLCESTRACDEVKKYFCIGTPSWRPRDWVSLGRRRKE